MFVSSWLLFFFNDYPFVGALSLFYCFFVCSFVVLVRIFVSWSVLLISFVLIVCSFVVLVCIVVSVLVLLICFVFFVLFCCLVFPFCARSCSCGVSLRFPSVSNTVLFRSSKDC